MLPHRGMSLPSNTSHCVMSTGQTACCVHDFYPENLVNGKTFLFSVLEPQGGWFRSVGRPFLRMCSSRTLRNPTLAPHPVSFWSTHDRAPRQLSAPDPGPCQCHQQPRNCESNLRSFSASWNSFLLRLSSNGNSFPKTSFGLLSV